MRSACKRAIRDALARLHHHRQQQSHLLAPTMASARLLAPRPPGVIVAAAGGRLSHSAPSRRRSPLAPAAAAAAHDPHPHPPARRGQRLGDVDTPALLVDLDAVERNALRLRAEMEALSGSNPSSPARPVVQVRPHFKAHKTPELASLVLRALGPALAPGVCAQKLGEAEAIVWSGEAAACGGGAGGGGGGADVCITNEVAPSAGKMRRLAALARHASRPRLSVAVDSAGGLRALFEAVTREAAEAAEAAAEGAAGAAGPPLPPPPHPIGVLVEVNVGQDRCGVDSPAEAAELAALIAELAEQTGTTTARQRGQHHSAPLLDFRGVLAYNGAIQHVRRASERRDASLRTADRAAAAVAAIEARGLRVGVVTGGGSGTCLFDAAGGVFTEVQPGSLFFGDADYARNEPGGGGGGGARGDEPWERRWRQAAWVAATVMSRSEARGVAVVDAGLKAVALDSGPPRVLLADAGGGGGEEASSSLVEFKNGGDEHGVLLFPRPGSVPSGSAPPLPPVGEVLRLLPGHCDPQWNLYDWVVAYRGGGGGVTGGDWRELPVECVWRVAARGPGT